MGSDLAVNRQENHMGFIASFPNFNEAAIYVRPVLAWHSPIASLPPSPR